MNNTAGKKNGKRSISLLLLLCVLLAYTAAGCRRGETESPGAENQVVKIPITFIVDSSTGKRNEGDLVDAFNREYAGKYQVDAEWVMETEEEYRQNLKRQNVTDELPAVITDLRMLPSFYRMMITDGRIDSLSRYLNVDEEWRAMIEPAVMEGCTEPSGMVYLAPLSTAAFSCSGIFWNPKLFEKAGIDEFPETWDAFWDCCEKLKAHGITPLALHTEGTAWAPMLLATAGLADTSEGIMFMRQLYPDSYQNEQGLLLADILKRLFDYTTEDALHNDFDVAYENFFSGKAAMLPNGYWMLERIPEDRISEVRFAAFPGNKLISSPETFGWSIVSDYSEEVKKAALEFLKFRTRLNMEEKEALFSQDLNTLSPAERDYILAYKNNPQIVPNYQVKWNSILQEVTLEKILPELATGKISTEEFVREMDGSIRQFEEEQ